MVADLPPNAPQLVPGVLKDISPIPNFYSNGLVFDPCNPAVLYTAGGNYPTSGGAGNIHGVFRSQNAGATWEQVVNLDSPARVRIDPRNPQHLYVVDGVNGSTNGFWRSLDGGKNWVIPQGFRDAVAQPGIGLYDTYDAEPDPTDFNHVLVTFHNPWSGYDGASGILESHDAGDHWVAHPPLPEWKGGYGYDVFFLFDPATGIGDSQTWLFTAQGGGYYRTTDSGKNWTKVSNRVMAHGGAQLYYTKDKVLYVTTVAGLVKSTDNGTTFTDVLPTGNTFSQFLAVGSDGTNLYAAPTNGGNLLTAKISDDSKWTTYNGQSFPSTGPYEMRYDAAHGILYSGNAAGHLFALKLK